MKDDLMDIEAGTVGSSFDDFLREEGRLDEAEAVAIKRVLAFQLEQAMKDQGITKSVMAKRMKTSRTQIDRLLDPDYEGVAFGFLMRAASALGRSLKIELA